MDYLVYISHDAENLQFYLWLQDYQKRYESLKQNEKALSPEWKAATAKNAEERGRQSKMTILSNTDVGFEQPEMLPPGQKNVSRIPSVATAAFNDAPQSPTTTDYDSFITSSALSNKTSREVAGDINKSVGLKWQPCNSTPVAILSPQLKLSTVTCQPFRTEIDKIIAHYIAPGSPRELNLSHRDRLAVLHALQHTTHPSAFAILATIVETVLRAHSHPNFVRYSICNGNKPRVFFVRSMGWIHSIGGILLALLLTLSSLSRWYRIIAGVVLFIGLSTLIAAQKGLCVILHHSHHRGLRPWEDDDSIANSELAPSTAKSLRSEDSDLILELGDVKGGKGGSEKWRAWSLQTFGAANTFTDEPWVARYKRKSLVRRVFDKSVWVQEESVRVVQDRIVMQSNLWSLIITTVVIIVFVAVPKGNLY